MTLMKGNDRNPDRTDCATVHALIPRNSLRSVPMSGHQWFPKLRFPNLTLSPPVAPDR